MANSCQGKHHYDQPHEREEPALVLASNVSSPFSLRLPAPNRRPLRVWYHQRNRASDARKSLGTNSRWKSANSTKRWGGETVYAGRRFSNYSGLEWQRRGSGRLWRMHRQNITCTRPATRINTSVGLSITVYDRLLIFLRILCLSA